MSEARRRRPALLPGDRIVAIGDTIVAGVKRSVNDIIAMLRGKRGSLVTVDVLRRGVPEIVRFDIIRDKIPVNSIDACYMVDDSTGYIRLSRFAGEQCQREWGKRP